jgi:hypothetical protein
MLGFYPQWALFVAGLLTGGGLRAIKNQWGFPAQYYVVVTSTALLTLLAFPASNSFLHAHPVLGFAVVYAAVVLTGAAVFTPSPVPLLLSLPCLLASAFFALFLTFSVLVAGAGMIG